MTTLMQPLLTRCAEGFTTIDGESFYVIPDVSRLSPFLMSLVSDSDHWCFVSSTGALTAGRRDAATALFPYETDDRLHRAAGISGPATVVGAERDGVSYIWEPFGRCPTPGARRGIAKSIPSDVVIFEEVDERIDLAMRFRWAASDRFGFVRKSELVNLGPSLRTVAITDGFVDLLPDGLVPELYHSMSNLTNAYRRSEVVDGTANLALHTLEALIVDQAIPAEALRATVSWSIGPGGATVSVDQGALALARDGETAAPVRLVTGRPGAHLVASTVTLQPGESASWYLVADVARDHSAVARLRNYLASADDVAADIEASLRADSKSLAAKLAAADACQKTGDDRASVHHAANVLFNVMRGGVFDNGYRCSSADFARFVAERNREVAHRRAAALADMPPELDHRDLIERAAGTADPDFERLALEYLPLTFSRRHGDPSRPWNRFSIRVREPDGSPVLRHEGNWRDIFQNWEALCLSYPHYLPSVVAVFVNASTADGFNPYRIARSGLDWETPDPDDPWSNIGYWGDHQIVYLLRLLEAADRLVPGALDDLLDRRIFTYADVPYRLADYDDLVADPRTSIGYDDDAADRAHARVAAIGGDGKLVTDPDGAIHRVTLLEKLVVPALAKLSSYVPDGGIWMNTQRPEWNDANNALAGYGLSMVTLYHLRRYLDWLSTLTSRRALESTAFSADVAEWLAEVTEIFRSRAHPADAAEDPQQRAAMMEALGRAFTSYRTKVYAGGLTGAVEVNCSAVQELCAAALPHLDVTIRMNRRRDGLYHSYNLIHFGGEGEAATIEHLPEMLEGQVAVLSCGLLAPAECAEVIDALFDSALYRSDQHSFILYPDRRPPSFVDKNVIPSELVATNRLLAALVAAGDDGVVVADVDGAYHFSAELRNAGALAAALDRLAADPAWRGLVDAHRGATLDAYEVVFRHHAFTGRSGTMYAYEGLGSIYWHMVAKLMVATQECAIGAHLSGAEPDVVDRLRKSYYRIRGGIGFNKTAADYGAFPTDPYSHTPRHAGAQQPGMTGQVKEEILTRYGELGVWFVDGELCFDPLLVRERELVTEQSVFAPIGIDGRVQTLELPPGSYGLTVCQVPIVVSATDGSGRVEVVRSDGSTTPVSGSRLDRATTREILDRSGEVAAVFFRFPGFALTPDPSPGTI